MRCSLNMLKTVFMGLLLLTSFTSWASKHHDDWNYEGEERPDNWGKLSPEFSLCATGKNQSPINIEGALKAEHEGIVIHAHKGKQKIINNGHTIQISVGDGNTLELDHEVFKLQQFHFHSPSENDIDGKQFPLEAHFVYQDQAGDLAVVALLFKEGKANQQLARAWAQMPKHAGDTAELAHPINIKKLLPERQDFYRFSGSLTTPPCTEGVRWLVLEHIADVSSEQVKQFHTVMHHHNNRPLQPLNGRVVIH